MNKTEDSLFTILKGTELHSSQQNTLSSTHIVFGNSASGKSSIIQSLTTANQANSVGLLYSYYHTNVAGKKQTLQLYEVSGEAFQHLKLLPVTRLNCQSVSYVIVVDLSENPSDLLDALMKQIEELRGQLERLLQKLLPAQEYQDMEQKCYAQIQNNPDRMKIRPLLLPLLVVGWKYDMFSKNLDVEVRKWITRGLRYISHLNNASLVYGSSSDPSLVRQAIHNQLSNLKINQSDHMKMVYMSRGVDSVEQIGLPQIASSQISPIDAINKIIKENVVVNPNPVKKIVRKKVGESEWEQHREDKIDRVKKEKERFQNSTQ